MPAAAAAAGTGGNTGARIALPARITPDLLAGHDPAAPIADLAGATMGTTWSVRCAAPAGFDRAGAAVAIAARLDGLVAEMSHWADDSRLAGFNRAPAGGWIALPPDFAHVMAAGLRIAAASDGAFDPAIGRVVDLWGHGPVAATLPPDERALAAAHATGGWRRLEYDPAGRRLRQPGGLSLDLSGIAKGHAADAVADLLGQAGVRHCLVEIGGELVGRGLRLDRDPWWVALEDPPGIALPPLRIALCGLAVATSGDYRRGNHTLDPRTGRPATAGIASASVIHARAADADAWATALTVLGAAEGMMLAARHGLAARIVAREGDGAREHLSPALTGMLAD